MHSVTCLHPLNHPDCYSCCHSGAGTLKTPVMALVERNGRVRSMPFERVSQANLKAAMLSQVDTSSTIMTDDLLMYRGITGAFSRGA